MMTDSARPDSADILPAPVRTIGPYFILLLTALLAYGNIFENQFVFDDDLLIRMNENLRHWDRIPDILTGSTTSGSGIAGGFFRPVQMLLFLLMFKLGGGTEWPFHLLNLSIHAANACLLYRLGDKMGFNKTGVFLASLLWAVHPTHTEAVTYISATADPLFGFFSLLGVVYLTPDFSPRKILKVIPIFALGILSKETMVAFPLLVCTCLFYFNERKWDVRGYVRTWPLWVIAVAYSLWRSQTTFFDGPATYARLYELPSFASMKLYADSFYFRLLTFWATLPAYLALLAWPTDLHMERTFPIFTEFFTKPGFTGFVFFAAASGLIVKQTVKPGLFLPLGWGVVWAFAAHAPDSGLLMPANSIFLEHWLYVPSMGLLLGGAETIARLVQARPVWVAAVPVCLSLAFTGVMASKTADQNRIWRTPDVFYENIFKYGEKSARARNNLALYYSDKGDYDKAIQQFNDAIQTSDTYAETRHNLALTWLRKGEKAGNVRTAFPEAIKHLNRALTIDPRFYRSWLTLQQIYTITGEKDKADYAGQQAQLLTGNGR